MSGLVLAAGIATGAGSSPSLVLEAKIALGDVRGRIDHLAYDAKHRRLFVAELGNGTVSVVDLKGGRVAHRITGLSEPQGLAYSAKADTLYVAAAGDGSVRAYRGEQLVPGPTIKLGADADNVRLDADESRVFVGYGAGAIAALDPQTLKKQTQWRLRGHPESFQLEPGGDRIFANVPDETQIAVFHRNTEGPISEWPMKEAHSNYPMALDSDGSRLFTVFRLPAAVGVHSLVDGSLLMRVASCGDADDIFVDERRRRAYVVCGEGAVDTLDLTGDALARLDRTVTMSGARTGLFVSMLDRLFVAVRATGSEPAAIWVFRPADAS